MKKHPINAICFLLFTTTLILAACGAPAPAQTAQPALTTATSNTSVSDVTPTIESTTIPTETVQPTQTATPTAAFTETAAATATVTITPTAEKTETIGEQLKSHIVFYLVLPGGKTGNKRKDACGNITAVPIISKRLRTGDKVQDVQIALKMLFSVGAKYYGIYYNALWDTDFTIDSYEYNAKEDYMTIQFGGYFPYSRLSGCDKHGIREQIWATFFHYNFREKTFKVADGFLIDRLGGD